MNGDLTNRHAHLANIRSSLMLARTCKQKFEIYKAISQYAATSQEDREMIYAPLIEMLKSLAALHRRFVKTSLELIEKQRGANYLVGHAPSPSTRLGRVHFSEWPEYKRIYAKDHDIWR